MKTFIVLIALVAAAVAGPLDARNAAILEYSSDNIGVGPFAYAYRSDNGIAAQAEGLVNEALPEKPLVIRGSYTYTGPDNVQYTVTYVADENGYRASGAHLPNSNL